MLHIQQGKKHYAVFFLVFLKQFVVAVQKVFVVQRNCFCKPRYKNNTLRRTASKFCSPIVISELPLYSTTVQMKTSRTQIFWKEPPFLWNPCFFTGDPKDTLERT